MKEEGFASDLTGELGWAAEREEFDQYSGRNNFELGKRDYISKGTVRGFLFTKAGWALWGWGEG